jgi:hypothetical protein
MAIRVPCKVRVRRPASTAERTSSAKPVLRDYVKERVSAAIYISPKRPRRRQSARLFGCRVSASNLSGILLLLETSVPSHANALGATFSISNTNIGVPRHGLNYHNTLYNPRRHIIQATRTEASPTMPCLLPKFLVPVLDIVASS